MEQSKGALLNDYTANKNPPPLKRSGVCAVWNN